MAADCRRVMGDRFVALVAYGPTRAAVFATQLPADDLAALTPLADRWHREGLETPLLLSPEEFRRSLDTFPLEYGALLDCHEVIDGTRPFGDDRPSDADLRRACEVHAKGFLIHLRQGWLHAADRHDEQAVLLQQSAAPLRALLRNIARLTGQAPADDQALAAFGETHLGLPVPVVADILGLDADPAGAGRLLSAPDFMPAYLRTAERLWAHVDQWRR